MALKGVVVQDQVHAASEVSFKLHEELAEALEIQSYRKLPVLSASRSRSRGSGEICPWLDGDVDVRVMDPNGAQVSPHELCTKLMAAAQAAGAELRIGAAEGVEMETDGDIERVTGVKVDGEVLEAEKVCVCLGPWAALAEDWFGMPVPMTGVKSSSIVYQTKSEVEPFAVFCGEDSRYGTHLEIYPRNSGEVYICGIGGSQYIDAATLRGENGGLLPSEVEPDPQRVEAATACFSEMSRKLGGKPDVVQACMRPCPPDALPIMGKVPHVKNAYISAGHNCWGILWAPVSGKAMSELILDGAAKCVDLRHFRPGRFAKSGTQAARRGRKMGTVPVGEQW
ncbi:unnamed protein product [Effrenium voratum]|uniref:FAD dependent oxidoreductase domain-containing protein n=1 Tax=Effrenium voratum TaxID=2562239 RepID=A0AA36MUK3_9DINO|nr:unnamed protein product [Effrenium voratum]